MRAVELPRNLVEAARRDTHDRRRLWLTKLPGIIADVAERWALRLADPYQPGGQTAWVAPVEASGLGPAVLKVMWRHPEGLHEAHGLRAWRGGPAVEVHRTEDIDDETAALLLERCVPGTSLHDRPEPEQDVVVASMLRRLWITPSAGHPFRRLAVMCAEWADEYEQETAGRPPLLDPEVAAFGIELFRSLPSTADREVLLCTDLHAGNILAARREPWLLVDPKPHVGDPTYDALQHMLNCPDRLHADPLALVARMADLLDLDAGRLHLWLFARCVQESPEWPGLAELAARLAPR